MIDSSPECGSKQYVNSKPLSRRQFQLTYDRERQDEDVNIEYHSQEALHRSPDCQFGAGGKVDDFVFASWCTKSQNKWH